MKIKIKRENGYEEFEFENAVTLLEALYNIKQNSDATLTFSSGCRSQICGECAVIVNGKHQLACGYKVQDGDEVEPIKNMPILRDLKVDRSKSMQTLTNAKAELLEYKQEVLSPKDEDLTQVQTDCILCNSCFSSCPVFSLNPNFLGPFALTRVYRYAVDKREANQKEHIDTIQQNGVWDCTLCGECTMACPKGIDPKADIMQLRNLSAKHGYMDPNFANNNFGGGFGFDPNGGF